MIRLVDAVRSLAIRPVHSPGASSLETGSSGQAPPQLHDSTANLVAHARLALVMGPRGSGASCCCMSVVGTSVVRLVRLVRMCGLLGSPCCSMTTGDWICRMFG